MVSRRKPEPDNTYDDIVLPDPDDFQPLTRKIEDCTDEDLQTLALALLSNSHHFCNEFVPTQLTMLRKQVSVVNRRLDRAASADDYVKLSATMKNLTSTYSQLLEQATVVFMSSYRPITALLQKQALADSKVSETAVGVEDTPVDTSDEIDTNSLEGGYNKYTD